MSEAAEFTALLACHLSGLVSLSKAQADQLYRHYEQLFRWNRVLNLTSIRGMEEIVVRHYCESLFLAIHLPPEAVSVADIGSGAGFPGVPIAVLRPDCLITLIESHRRKAVFLREATREYGNVQVLPKRVEDVAEVFDWAVSRAVKWAGIASALGRLARHIALLVGEEDALQIRQDKWEVWKPSIVLPWGERRVLVIGDVPRET